LDVHFGEDFCRVKDEIVRQAMNVARKIALNCVKIHKQKTGSKLPQSKDHVRLPAGLPEARSCLDVSRKLISVT